mgnify:FL=1
MRGIEGTIEREEIREAVEKIVGQWTVVGIDIQEKSGETTEGEDQSRKENKGKTKFKPE